MTTHSLPQTTPTRNDFFAVITEPAADIQIGTDLPLSPAEVAPTATLAELRAIKEHWLNIAEQTGDLKTLLLVTRELGQEITPTSWLLTLPGNITADLNVTGFACWRDGDLARLTVTFEGKVVCQVHRTARRIYTDTFSGGTAPLFIPGPWMDAFRSLQPQAERQSIARYQAAIEADRQALLAELGIPLTPDTSTPDTPPPAVSSAPAVPSAVIVQPLATPTTPASSPFVVDGFEVTRFDFFCKDDGNVIVQRLAITSPIRDQHVVVASEIKPVDLTAAAAWLHRHGYCTRRWPAVETPTYKKPAGMRAWKGDEPWAIRTEGQIRKIRQQLNGHAAGLGHSINIAFDL